jgi:hypothetical protein
VRILKLHGQYPAHLVEQAVALALDYGCLHAAGVELCLRQLQQSPLSLPALDLAAHPQLVAIAQQGPDLHCYDQLLTGR